MKRADVAREELDEAFYLAEESLGSFQHGDARSLLATLRDGWIDPDATLDRLTEAQRITVLKLAFYAALKLKKHGRS